MIRILLAFLILTALFWFDLRCCSTAKTFSTAETVAAAELAGWTYLGTLVTDV
jgi:hypothetical protein